MEIGFCCRFRYIRLIDAGHVINAVMDIWRLFSLAEILPRQKYTKAIIIVPLLAFEHGIPLRHSDVAFDSSNAAFLQDARQDAKAGCKAGCKAMLSVRLHAYDEQDVYAYVFLQACSA